MEGGSLESAQAMVRISPQAFPMAPLRVAALTAGSLVCFAANSLLCRAALGRGLVDPATFTLVRIG
jgi:hypothetical protein